MMKGNEINIKLTFASEKTSFIHINIIKTIHQTSCVRDANSSDADLAPQTHILSYSILRTNNHKTSNKERKLRQCCSSVWRLWVILEERNRRGEKKKEWDAGALLFLLFLFFHPCLMFPPVSPFPPVSLFFLLFLLFPPVFLYSPVSLLSTVDPCNRVIQRRGTGDFDQLFATHSVTQHNILHFFHRQVPLRGEGERSPLCSLLITLCVRPTSL